MAAPEARRFVVMMGDLVGSERLSDTKALHARFNEAVDTRNQEQADAIASPLTITLGDEF